jgi:hypothetical protein
MKTKFVIVCLLLVQHMFCAAQVVFSLRPYVGLQGAFSKVEDKNTAVSTFKNNRFDITNVDYSLFLEAKVSKSVFSIGYTNWAIDGIKFTLRLPEPSNTRGEGPRSSHGLQNDHQRIMFRYGRELKSFPIFQRIKPSYAKKSLAEKLLRLEGFVGAGISLTKKPNYDKKVYPGLPNEFAGDTIRDIIYVDRLNPQALLLQAGLTLHWVKNQKDRLAITLYYNQGIGALTQYRVEYYLASLTMPGRAYNTPLSSRGTSLGINLSYPITFYRSDKYKIAPVVAPSDENAVLYRKDTVATLYQKDSVISRKNNASRKYADKKISVGVNGSRFGSKISSTTTFNLRVGYFLSTKFMIGLEGYHSQSMIDDILAVSDTQEKGLGIFGRYYLGNKRLRFFMEIAALRGQHSYNEEKPASSSRKYNTTFIQLVPGMSVRVWKSLSLELGLRLSDDRQSYYGLDVFAPQIGIQYDFSLKK